MDRYVEQWLFAFALTQVVEVGVYASLLSPSRPRRERLALAFAASAITHPMVWFVLPPAMDALRLALGLQLDATRAYWATVAVSEAFAVGVEAGWLACFGLRWRWAALGALLANGASFLIGLLGYQLPTLALVIRAWRA